MSSRGLERLPGPGRFCLLVERFVDSSILRKGGSTVDLARLPSRRRRSRTRDVAVERGTCGKRARKYVCAGLILRRIRDVAR